MCTFQTYLNKINKKIINVSNEITKDLKNLNLSNEIIESCGSFKVNDFNKNNEKLNCAGIYIFIFNSDDNIDIDEFNNCEYASKIKNNKGEKIDVKKGKILYVGKSGNLLTRLSEHINSVHETTYSLKLSNENRKQHKDHLKVQYYVFKNDVHDFYSIIARRLEQTIAENLKDQLLISNK